MEAIAQLNEWFTDKDYDAGIAIYNNLGFSAVLKNLFKKGPNQYNTAKLEAELTKLNEKHSKISVDTVRTKIVQKQEPITLHSSPNTPAHPTRYTVPKVNDVIFDKLPNQLKYEWAIRIQLFRDANAHHYRLDSLTDPIEIKKSVKFILDNFEQIDQYWVRIDYYLDHGIVLPSETDKPEIKDISDPFEMLTRRANIRSYITKARKKVMVLKDTAKIADTNQKIARWEIELADLDKKIKAHG